MLDPLEGLTSEIATSILDSRLRSIHRRIPDQDKRNKFYRLVFSIPDCQLVEAEEDSLLAKFRATSDWAEWDQATRIAALHEIADFALKLRTIREATGEELPENFKSILSAWLSGRRPIEIAEMEKKSGSDLDPASVAKSSRPSVFTASHGPPTAFMAT